MAATPSSLMCRAEDRGSRARELAQDRSGRNGHMRLALRGYQGTMAPEITHRELEVKLSSALDFELPDLRSIVGRTVRLPEQHFRTAYFDTPDLRLWNRGVTLRYRAAPVSGSGQWMVKMPNGDAGDALDRCELSWTGESEVVPVPAQELLLGIVRRSPLRLLAELETSRQRFVFRDAEGQDRGELDDDTVVVLSGRSDECRFRQIELELATDGARAVDPGVLRLKKQVVRQLKKAGARPDSTPKLAMALELPSDDPVGGPVLDRHAAIGDVVRASLDGGLRRLLDHDPGLRMTPPDPPAEHVHQARVATRRLRSDLKTFGTLLDPVWVKHTRDELRWLGDALGKVRDIDVLGDSLFDETRSEEFGELRMALDEERTSAAEAVAEVLRSQRYLDLLDRLHRGAQQPPFYGHVPPSEPAVDVLPHLVATAWRAVRKRVRRAGRPPGDRELHRIRIAAKQLRYASEAAEPVVGKAAARTALEAKALQTVLGDHHDSVMAEEWLRQSRSGTTDRLSTGWLAALQQVKQRTLRRKWRSIYGRLSAPKRRRWLQSAG